MTVPNLLHPVPVVIQQLDMAATTQDPDYREPIQQASRKIKTTVPGQVKWEGDKELTFNKGGVQQKADGYVLFRYVDLEAASITLRDNDRFTKIGNLDTDVYVMKLLPNSHYEDQGGATLVKAFFADRQPSRQGRGV